MKKIFIISSVIASFILGGCQNNKYGSASIISNPSGAEVINLDDGTILGVTPLMQVWSDEGNRKFINIQIDKDGFKTKATSFWLTLDHRSRQSAVNNPQLVEIMMDTKRNSNKDEDIFNAITQ